jgi:hypothetical protein
MILHRQHQTFYSTMSSREREPTDPPSPWRNSHAKQLLKEDIVAVRATSSMSAKEVYAMQPKWYKGYKFQDFKQRKSMRCNQNGTRATNSRISRRIWSICTRKQLQYARNSNSILKINTKFEFKCLTLDVILMLFLIHVQMHM